MNLILLELIIIQFLQTADCQGCEDIQPVDSTLNCEQIARLNLCYSISTQYCQKACNGCKLQKHETSFLIKQDDYHIYDEGNFCNSEDKEGMYCLDLFNNSQDSEGVIQAVDDVKRCSMPESLDCDVEGLLAFKGGITRGIKSFKSWIGKYLKKRLLGQR
eukprot:TRINITY_DN239_c3_g1_i8.p1 TRINITY_DN239_c3_g1~~TRINITY_DN239_c3_g1_i8.p1  ORF type:complete len:160 (-),score=11.04 TRINITY_DN239_c3_g1_i8:10-489(-)